MSKSRDSKGAPFRMGALVVLSICFVTSAFLRAGEVVAELPGGSDDGFGNPIPSQTSGSPDANRAGADTPVGADGNHETPTVLLQELRRQREVLEAREAEVVAREQTLKTIGNKLNSRLQELRAARERLASTAALVDDAAGKDVRRLADMYQQMKPKQAGQIFNEMAPSFAAGFIAEMRPDTAALIMANMEAEKAYAVSLLIAGRNVQPVRSVARDESVDPDVTQ